MTRSLAVLVIVALVGCGSGTPSSGDASTTGDFAGGGGSGGGGGGSGGACQTAADCRLYSSYCASAPCQCFALGLHDVDPPCTGGQQSCIVDPCNNKRALCTNGACALMQ